MSRCEMCSERCFENQIPGPQFLKAAQGSADLALLGEIKASDLMSVRLDTVL